MEILITKFLNVCCFKVSFRCACKRQPKIAVLKDILHDRDWFSGRAD